MFCPPAGSHLVLDGIPELRLVHQTVHDVNICPLSLECSEHPERISAEWRGKWSPVSLTCPIWWGSRHSSYPGSICLLRGEPGGDWRCWGSAPAARGWSPARCGSRTGRAGSALCEPAPGWAVWREPGAGRKARNTLLWWSSHHHHPQLSYHAAEALESWLSEGGGEIVLLWGVVNLVSRPQEVYLCTYTLHSDHKGGLSRLLSASPWAALWTQ